MANAAWSGKPRSCAFWARTAASSTISDRVSRSELSPKPRRIESARALPLVSWSARLAIRGGWEKFMTGSFHATSEPSAARAAACTRSAGRPASSSTAVPVVKVWSSCFVMRVSICACREAILALRARRVSLSPSSNETPLRSKSATIPATCQAVSGSRSSSFATAAKRL